MAELTYSRRSLTGGGGSGGSSDNSVSLEKRTLIRTGSSLAKDTAVFFNAPGPGWVALGPSLTYSGAAGFTGSTQVYRNGQLLHVGADASADNDVYFLSVASCAFESPLVKNDVIQFWHFTTASG